MGVGWWEWRVVLQCREMMRQKEKGSSCQCLRNLSAFSRGASSIMGWVNESKKIHWVAKKKRRIAQAREDAKEQVLVMHRCTSAWKLP